MSLRKWAPSVLAVLAIGLAATFTVVDHAEARRGGGFGSRGGRTYQAPPATPTAPRTQPTAAPQANPMAARPATASRPGFFGSGFAGSMMRGLLIGGLIGVLLGQGVGGLAGLFGLLLQVGLVALAIMLVMRLFRSRQPATAGGPAFGGQGPSRAPFPGQGYAGGSMPGAYARNASAPQPGGVRHDGVGIGQDDLSTFERLLAEIQMAFGREDHAALNQRTTPEVMAQFAGELSQNATQGLRNEVDSVRLLQGDLAEAWREGNLDYATVAMRYESRDVTRERTTNRVVSGNPDHPTQTTEIWTFVRPRGGDWRLSAIQDA